MGQPTYNGFADAFETTAPSVPVVINVGLTLQDGFVSGDVLAGESVESAECGEVRSPKSRLGRGEGFHMGCAGVSIIGRPRHLPG